MILYVLATALPLTLAGCGDPRDAGAGPVADLPDLDVTPAVVRDHLDLTGAAFPARPVHGTLAGQPFKLDLAERHDATNVVVLHGASGEMVFIFVPGETLPVGTAVDMRTPRGGFDVPHVHVHFTAGDGNRGTAVYMDGYVMTLAFDEPRDGVIHGRVNLSLPDQYRSHLAGTFDIPLQTQ